MQKSGIKLIILITCLSALILSQPPRVLAEEKRPTAEGTFNEGFSYFEKKVWDQAIEYFNKALQIDPKYKKAWFFKGVTFQRMGRFEEELKCYEEYIKIDSTEAVVWYNKGVALGRLKKYSEAEKAFISAEKIDPKYPWTYYGRGVQRIVTGNYEAALKDLERSKSLGMPSYAHGELERYIIWCKRLLRQMTGFGSNLPIVPKEWKPNYDEYHTVVETRTRDNPLIDMPEPDYRPPSPSGSGGLVPAAGLGGTRISFKGTPEDPFLYAAGFLVWDGAVISDKKFGVLLENGTKFKHTKIEGDYKIERIGVIKGWKAEITSESKFSIQVK